LLENNCFNDTSECSQRRENYHICFECTGSWLTLHYCELYYLSAVNYDPVTTGLIFIRVSIYPGPGKGGLLLILKPIYFIRVTIYPATFPHNIGRGHYLPWGLGGGCFLVFSYQFIFIRVTIYPGALAHNISRGHYLLPCFGLYQGHYLH
jgi:hypothetical protein